MVNFLNQLHNLERCSAFLDGKRLMNEKQSEKHLPEVLLSGLQPCAVNQMSLSSMTNEKKYRN